MKIATLIESVTREKPNAFSRDDLTDYVNEIEAMVQDYIGIEPEDMVRYVWKNDGDRELMVKPPYDMLYKSYLKAKIDYANEEYESYANNQAQFADDYEDWQAYAMRSGLVINDTPEAYKNWW